VPSGVPTGVPQFGQKLAPSGSGSPQTGQGVMGSRIGAEADVPGVTPGRRIDFEIAWFRETMPPCPPTR
jgi:hypothetical protein